MQSTSEGCLNIAELANQLKREKIFISSERQLLQTLNAEVEKCTLELLQVAWICSQQRQNLTNLITSRSEADSIAACQKASLLEATTFIDAYKVLKYKEANALSELLGWLRDSPQLVAVFLLLGEEELGGGLVAALAGGLYGSGRCPSDRARLLGLIRSLIKHQLTLPQPRKLFRSGACALSQLYAVFRDGHTPVREFLVAALQGPVMNVLREDEFFLDLDPDKAMERFSSSDRLKKFGQPASAEYQAKVARYRKWTVQSLYNLTSRFIASLKEHWGSFPPALAWLLHQLVMLLKQAGVPSREVHAACSELVMAQALCPAVVNPEAHGVVDVPLSYIARFNLMQIAQILQMLCLAKFQEVDAKVRDVYSRFDRSCVYSLLDAAIAAGGACAVEGGGAEPPLRTEPPVASTAALFTDQHLKQLITFLKHVSSKLNNNTPSVTSEETPSSAAVADASTFSEGGGCSSSLAQLVPPASRARLSDLLRLQPDLTHYRPPPPEPRDHLDNGTSRLRILGKLPLRPRAPTSPPEERPGTSNAPQVLVINLPNVHLHDTVGLVPESKVLECYYGGSEAGDADETGSALAVAGPGAPVQKRTRFSVSHDEVSLGNTSDNLEAVSEAASNHSCTSSLELEPEDQNDNLSDMVSANVSGRGSPNISGRETPSSQVTDGDAAGEGPPRRLPQNVPVNQANSQQAKLLKQTRNDIEDKFGKFEIKKLLEGDETISIMSDTWSTDVLASDSETIGDSCDHASANHQGTNANSHVAPDPSETASESAWSIDVLASDSDRNTEVDTDDCVSVAARSDTSWPRRPSAHEDSVPRAPAARGSPRHAAMPHRTGYLSATAQLSRGAELDLMARSPHNYAPIENRKSILVNGYPMMTCYTASAPESPSTSAPAPLTGDVFDYVPQNNDDGAATESTVDGGNNSDATSQWVDDSFPPRAASPRDFPSTSKMYEQPDDRSCDQSCDQSRGSSESEFNAMSVSQYDRRFDSGIEPDRAEERSTITDLMTRMSSASISTSNLVTNLTARIVKSEIRTSIVSISSSRVEKRQNHVDMSSTLSVNSAESSDKSSSQDVNSEQVTERRVSPPPQKVSTGAIPKSISFDATAEKTQRRRIMGEDGLAGNLDELKNNVKRSGGNILHKIKMFRQKGRSINHSSDMALPFPSVPATGVAADNGESSEDILAKYRRAGGADTRARRPSRPVEPQPEPAELERLEGVVDLNDPEVFNSMKRRLRLVMSNPELHCVEYVPSRTSRTSLTQWVRAAAISASSVTASAHATELARALAGATATGGGDTAAARLAAALRADLAARRPYANYLNSCRAGLTHTLHTLNSQISIVRSECEWCARAAAAARVLEQLDQGPALRRLQLTHHHNTQRSSLSGELMDEKAARLTANIKAITAEVKADPSWDGASPALLQVVEVTVERAAFARLYLHVLFPNGDGDIARDQVLSEHIRRLSGGASCAALGVPARHLWAAPFRSAQLALSYLPVYTTPRDKLACITRCVTCIMSVLGLTEGAAAAADDLTPVLVYVIIKVNPPSLLSTIELVSALGGPALAGEALCWWTHFCAAVAYIKTMDYPRAGT